MIVHQISTSYNDRTPLELYGFPPWQMRLTEILSVLNWQLRTSIILADNFWRSYNRYPQSVWSRSSELPLGEKEFRAALDEFAGAQMRLGK